ncbi:MAG: peptidase E, partial [Tannerellaceae bacterium]|nr:peptidase E [Tannerellaceae bacterium]
MKRICIITVFISLFCIAGMAQVNKTIEQTIFAFGGDIKPKFIQYVVDLTNKSNPKVCYIPTASADNVDNLKYWDFICKQLSIEPNVLKVWVSSDKNAKTFEETLLDMDAIVVGGGNTLNMMAIWKAQGIDTILNKALRKGIILAGGSAGSICWFQNGISDSRPTSLSVVDGLSILPYSNCPHYADSTRKSMYHQLIQNRK